jgi:hypothetical protein
MLYWWQWYLKLYFSKSDKIQDFHMIVDDNPVVVDESIKFSFNNVNNEVVLVNNTSTLSTDTCIYPVGVASLVYQVLCANYVLVRVVSGEGSSTHCQH